MSFPLQSIIRFFAIMGMFSCLYSEVIAQEDPLLRPPLAPIPESKGMTTDTIPQVKTGSAIHKSGESLEGAWASALAVDPELEASRWDSSAAQKGLYAARAERMPSISARSSYSVYDNPLTINAPVGPLPPILPSPTTASVTVNQREFFLGGVSVVQPLYTFGRINNAIKAAGAEVNAALSNQQRSELDVKLQVGAAYIGVLKAQRLLEVAENSVKSLEEHARDVKNLVDQGVGIRANLLAAQVALANVRQLRLQVDNLLIVAKSAYNRSLQRPLSTPVHIQDLSKPATEYVLDYSIQTALSRRPEIGFLSAKVRAMRSLADSVRAANHPQIFLEGGFSYIENRFLDNEAYNNISVMAEWNFWDSGRKRHRKEQLEHSAEALLRRRKQIESLIALEVKKSWHDLSSARQQVAVNEQSLKSADENLRVSKNRFKQGVGTNTEVLDAQTLQTQTYSNYYNSLYDFVLAEIQLLRAMGSL